LNGNFKLSNAFALISTREVQTVLNYDAFKFVMKNVLSTV